MNYIEEMMKACNANDYLYILEHTIDKERIEIKKYGFFNHIPSHIQNGYKVVKVIKRRPPFTPEKQLEIIKEIGLRVGFKIIANEGFDWILTEDMYAKHEYNKQGYSITDFSQALAQLVTELIKSNELDKREVKRILEG